MTNEPFAYAAVAMDASESTYVTTSREQAEAACREYGWQLVPLYAGPTFTAAEREAVENCIYASERIGDDWSDKQAATLRGLLERHCPTPEKRPVQDNTPDTHTNPAKGSVQDSVT